MSFLVNNHRGSILVKKSNLTTEDFHRFKRILRLFKIMMIFTISRGEWLIFKSTRCRIKTKKKVIMSLTDKNLTRQIYMRCILKESLQMLWGRLNKIELKKRSRKTHYALIVYLAWRERQIGKSLLLRSMGYWLHSYL